MLKSEDLQIQRIGYQIFINDIFSNLTPKELCTYVKDGSPAYFTLREYVQYIKGVESINCLIDTQHLHKIYKEVGEWLSEILK